MGTFSEIVDGVGLEEVPKQYRRELCCCYCVQSDTGKCKLYTPNGCGFKWGTLAQIRQGLDAIRHDCYCKHHATMHFRD